MESRRNWLQSVLSWLASGSAVKPEPEKAESCLTPAYAGFDGSFLLNTGWKRKIILARAFADNPSRYSIIPGMMGVWKNRDGSVSKLVYRNHQGELFDLQFVPLKECP